MAELAGICHSRMNGVSSLYQILWRKSCDLNAHVADINLSYVGYGLTDSLMCSIDLLSSRESLF